MDRRGEGWTIVPTHGKVRRVRVVDCGGGDEGRCRRVSFVGALDAEDEESW